MICTGVHMTSSSLARVSAVGLAAATALLAGPVPAGSASAARPQPAGSGWRLYATVAQRGKSVLLGNVDAVGPADAWAAGLIGGPKDQHQRALLVHWNGVAWSRVALPARAASLLGGNLGFVYVAARSDRDAWVFSQMGRYLRLRRGHWILGRVPLRRGQSVFLDQAVVFGPRDVWVFGLRFVGPVSKIDLRPYAARFDGRGWATVPVPGKGALAVSAISSRDMWAVTGTDIPGSGLPASPRVVRWNGHGWHVVKVQPLLPRHATLDSILAERPSEVWLGGSRPNRKTGASELARRWNGRSWAQVNPPARPSEQDIYLQSLVPDGAGGVWSLTGSLGSADPGPAQVWHYARGGWSGPQPVSPRWLLFGLGWVPRTRSIWGVAGSSGLVKGLIILHGPVPR
jgi:hypothetical protein